MGENAWPDIFGICRYTCNPRGTHTSSIIPHVANVHVKVVDKLGLSYRTPKELNDIIDKELPGRPPFQCAEFVIGGISLQFYYRDILQCIRTIYGDPEFARDLVFAPERHYTDRERTCRVYSEMHTGEWWWAVQVSPPLLFFSKLTSYTYNFAIDIP